jgi:membrane protease YdiL (CAAX protease family)
MPDENRDVPTRALLPFFALTFVASWAILLPYVLFPASLAAAFGELSASHPLFLLAVYGPAIAAFVVVGYYAGVGGLRRFVGRLALWRCSPIWYAFLLIGIPLVFFAGAALAGRLPEGWRPFDNAGALLGAMFFMAILGPVEEFGWRGVALPLMQRKLAPAWAGLILGAIWGAWHLPAFFLSGTPQGAWSFTPFLAGSIAISVILTPLFNRSRGSLLLAAFYHYQMINPLWPDAQPWDYVLFVALAAVIVWLCRESMFDRSAGVTEVAPHRYRTPDGDD